MSKANKPDPKRRWPAVVVSALILAAAVFSFWPRALPEYPETRLHPERLLVNGVARSGERLVAVGELGHILIADSAEGPWREAGVSPQRGSTLTRVHFIDADTAIAVGHDGWILRSDDRGESWAEVDFDEDQTEPLLDIGGPWDGVLHVVGGFGLYRVSDDEGRSWRTVDIEEIESEDEGGDAAADEDPFAMYDPGISDRHLNGIVRLEGGRLLLAGESGLVALSDDGGERWSRIDEIYAGSFFGALALPDGGVLVYGMRGHVFLSTDGGRNWTQAEVPDQISLFGGAVDEQGRIVLVGAGNTLVVSEDGGRSFSRGLLQARSGLSDVLPMAAGDGWLTAGESGVRVQTPRTASPDDAAAAGDRS